MIAGYDEMKVCSSPFLPTKGEVPFMSMRKGPQPAVPPAAPLPECGRRSSLASSTALQPPKKSAIHDSKKSFFGLVRCFEAFGGSPKETSTTHHSRLEIKALRIFKLFGPNCAQQ